MTRNNLIFGGIDCDDFGVWISGSDTYGSPERDSEHVAVPGRNGDLIIDNGRWKNKIVTYPAFFEKQFPERMRAFREAISRKIGYQRLEDSYHPDEFRMAELINGINPSDTTQFNRGGNFELSFNCKPQRFLKSGEDPLVFMPPHIVADTMYTHYVHLADGSQLNVTIHCPANETVDVTISFCDSDGSNPTSHTYSGEADGSKLLAMVVGADRYVRIGVSGYSNADNVWLNVSGVAEIGGEPYRLDAIMARSWKLSNPTGYGTKPLIEVYEKALPHITISNYTDGERTDYYEFGSNQTSANHFWLDTDVQWMYDADMNNLTNYMYITTMGSRYGEGLVFPEFGENEIRLYMYYTVSSIENGLGIVKIYPNWWRI